MSTVVRGHTRVIRGRHVHVRGYVRSGFGSGRRRARPRLKARTSQPRLHAHAYDTMRNLPRESHQRIESARRLRKASGPVPRVTARSMVPSMRQRKAATRRRLTKRARRRSSSLGKRRRKR